MILAKIASVAFLSSIMIWPFDCHQAEAQNGFEGGIRNITYLGYYAGLGASTTIGGVLDTGQLIFQTGDSQGTDSIFAGKTDLETGIDDHPNAITDSSWNLQTSWDDVAPECDIPEETNINGRAVPLAGDIEEWTCTR